MNFGFEIIPISSGKGGRLYSYRKEGQDLDEYRRLLADHQSYPDSSRLSHRLRYLAESAGLREQFFKSERERGIKAPIWRPRETGIIRVFCLIVDVGLVIAGNGGIKNGGRFQEYPHLDQAYGEIFYVWLRLSESLDQGGTKIEEIYGRPGISGRLTFEREAYDRSIPRRT